MAIPDFQSVMLPLLKIFDDGQEHTSKEIIERLALEFNLSEEEQRELLPSGRQSRFENRVRWAIVYLKKACLLESVSRGKFVITRRGINVLRTNPNYIDDKYLRKFTEFIEFRDGKNESEDHKNKKSELIIQDTNGTPEEILESCYQTLRRDLANELIERVKKCSPAFLRNLWLTCSLRWDMGGQEVMQVERLVGVEMEELTELLMKTS